jgi:hypothetical protein
LGGVVCRGGGRGSGGHVAALRRKRTSGGDDRRAAAMALRSRCRNRRRGWCVSLAMVARMMRTARPPKPPPPRPPKPPPPPPPKCPSLILKRAPIGPNVEYYDVLEDGKVVGCIFLSQAAPVAGRSWKWASGHNGDLRRAAHGHEPTREAAMAAFAKSWRRNSNDPARVRITEAGVV